MADFLLDHVYKLVTGLVFIIAYVLRIEYGMKGNRETIDTIQEDLESMSKESQRQREKMDNSLTEMRAEMNTNFSTVNQTLKEVIFRLGDKTNK